MKTPDLLHVEVTHLSRGSTRCSLGWMTADGMQFHFWTTLETKRPAPGSPLYKNCPVGLKSGDPGHFNARHLHPLSARNAAMIREAIRVADEMMLWTKAIEELDAKIMREHAEHMAAAAIYRAKEGGPRLLAAAEAFVKWWHTFEGAKMIAEIHHPDVTEFYAAIAASKEAN